MQHQEALIQAQFDEALALLKRYDACHHSHMLIEERYLFPEFELIDRQTRWDLSLYEKEHEKIRKLYSVIAEDTAWLKEQQFDHSQTMRNIIALLDKEKTFKGLTEHHEEREEDAMLKELDEQLELPHLKELVSDIRFTWVEVMGSLENLPHD